jgi:DNA-binding MarR family transcriptional regulator
MEKEKLLTLTILEELDNDGFQSQRNLSKKLGMALGLTNAYIKRLVAKGYIMVKKMPKRRIFYNLTPMGIYEKAKLTWEFMKYSIDYYKELRGTIKKTFLELEKKGMGKVVFCGISEIAEIAYITLQESSIKLIGIIDDDKAGEKFLGWKVLPFARIKDINPDVIIITSIENKDEIGQKLLDLGIEAKKILLFSGHHLTALQKAALSD